MHVLFVCTGNICRSPTAERLAAAYVLQNPIPGFTASSAGTRAVIGNPIHHEAALVLEKMGVETSHFAARQLTQRVASSADLVVTMARRHRDSVLELAPRLLRKTFTLTELARLVSEHQAQTVEDLTALRPLLTASEVPDITDPIGHDAEVFARIGAQIADLLPPVLELCRRSSSSAAG
ncbi:low molecular weight phosphatase family protein [Mycolicibacterium komossense]|uniref:Low molecular weight phosphatase family protein n=1 Tax=Mycolicibacterium komossense TaxID=1779 RepID=A0ABT3CDH4_9MYCO|nr:low molecular weight phosphatase family protein [Mycolicibacterium komossense]